MVRLRETSGLGLHVYRRLLTYALRYWRRLLVAVIGMVIYASTDTGFAAFMKPMLDGSFVERDPQVIKWAPFALIGILLLRGLGAFLSRYYMSYIARMVVKQIRGEMFRYLLRAPVAFYDHTSSGQLISKLTYNVEQVSDTATKGFTILIRDTLTVIGLLAWMFYLNWLLALGFLIVFPLITGLVAYVSKLFRKLSHKIQDSMGDVTHVAEEMIEGHRVVKIFGGEDYESQRFERANERNRRMMMRWVATHSASSPVIQLIVGLALAGIIFLATRGPILEQVTVGTFVSFMIAIVLLLPPARSLTDINSVLQRGIAAGQSIFELLDSEREHERAEGVTMAAYGRIEFKAVRFHYDPDKGDVLKGVSFAVAPGETIALVGRSGSGKSTLVNLLPRFYETIGGEILLDGIDIRDYRLSALREQITYVSQEVILFNDTIANNIAYGRAEEMEREAIWRVAQAAHAAEFIEKLPDGLDTLVGENGILLSGGQRQRLAIARALLKDAPILILDEATSSLDTEAERQIQAALETLVRDRTTLVIAHRLSTVERADRILVLQDGQIAESGKHTELLERNGIYTRLYRQQLRDLPVEESSHAEPREAAGP